MQKPDILKLGKKLPSMYDLPSEDQEEPGLPDEFHLYQPQILSQTCQPLTYPPDQVFIASDLNLYYDLEHFNWYKRPDWFVVVGGSRFYRGRDYRGQDLRQSYVIWDEGVSPLLVVELLSEGTESEDLGRTLRKVGNPPTKWEVYEQILQVPYYATFDERNSEFRRFRLRDGQYTELRDEDTRFWIEELQLGLGIWYGSYQRIEKDWLRWYDAEGRWLLTQEEQTEQERLRAEQERQKVEMLKAQLRALGIEPDI
jgi:Uma2 family endonuclease